MAVMFPAWPAFAVTRILNGESRHMVSRSRRCEAEAVDDGVRTND